MGLGRRYLTLNDHHPLLFIIIFKKTSLNTKHVTSQLMHNYFMLIAKQP